MQGIESTALYAALLAADSDLAHRLLRVRTEVEKWLPSIAQFFPHYPSHGVDHSDRIIRQLSRLLANENKLTVKFSSAELYCLMSAAYLHDMGMVVSPGDAEEILKSDAWNQFIEKNGAGHESYTEYTARNTAASKSAKDEDQFLANLNLRYLIADFVRRSHHQRGKTTLQLHPFLKQHVDDGDSVAFETISDLGVAHGLPDAELSDQSRFPEQRDVFDGKVNVRFLARLLRIGDLLDMDTKRADPMTAKAVGPLPTDAVPHWQQYSSMKHENVAPDTIQYRFECENQDTHRVLRDWFGCLESEVKAVGMEQLHAKRHADWKPPRCVVASQSSADDTATESSPTIILKPAKGATYRFHDWKLELDQERVLHLLIHDAYNDPTVFVRELIQNALDATRCQMYRDFADQNPGQDPPARPTQFEPDFREQYGLSLSLTNEDVEISPDGPKESRPVFTIEDRGIGMSEQIIQRYFLQVGRSYYKSTAFKERYEFAPTSRFGIGFLSVFAVSSDITVETACRDDDDRVQAVRLKLREPKNYLLTEQWDGFTHRPPRERTGTRICIVLDKWPTEATLTNLVSDICIAAEVPVAVTESGKTETIRAREFTDREVLKPCEANPDARFIQRVFPLESDEVEGVVTLVAYEDADGEAWCDCWPRPLGLQGKALDQQPNDVFEAVALHGVARTSIELERRARYYMNLPWGALCDVRAEHATTDISRNSTPLNSLLYDDDIENSSVSNDVLSIAKTNICSHIQQAVVSHIKASPHAQGKTGAYYVADVLSAAPLKNSWRDTVPNTVIAWHKGKPVKLSVNQLLALEEFEILSWEYDRDKFADSNWEVDPSTIASDVHVVSLGDIPNFADKRFATFVRQYNVTSVLSQNDMWVFRLSKSHNDPKFKRVNRKINVWASGFADESVGGIIVSSPSNLLLSIANINHPVAKWLDNLSLAAGKSTPIVTPDEVEDMFSSWILQNISSTNLLRPWIENTQVPKSLRPPQLEDDSVTEARVERLYSRRTLRNESKPDWYR